MPDQPTGASVSDEIVLSDVVFEATVIEQRVAELGQEIGEYYRSGELLLIGLLKGSFMFLADLVRYIQRPHEIDFVAAASYGSGRESSGQVHLRYDPETDVAGKHVLLVEDIIESGTTLNHLVRLFRAREPASLEICTLLHKRIAKETVLEPRFVGFDAPDKFLVGYGLDCAEKFRYLPYIASLKE